MADDLGRQSERGLEVMAVHIGHDGMAHLTGHNAAIEITRDVHCGDEQFSVKHVNSN